MTRREFISLVGGAVAWPLAARAEPLEGFFRGVKADWTAQRIGVHKCAGE
jgi:hypothetical protein